MKPTKCNNCSCTDFIKKGLANGKQRWSCTNCNKKVVIGSDAFEWDIQLTDEEIVEQAVKSEFGKQKARDTNRIERKSFREHARKHNAVEALGTELTNLLKEKGEVFSIPFEIDHPIYSSDGVGVIQISDTHFNELIDLDHNKYDFKIASKRLHKFINECLDTLDTKVNKVLIAFTGDLVNSDRRLDELLNMSTNRAKACMLSVDLLKNVILHVAEYYPVSVVSVLGNESRMGKEMPFSANGLSDNYDFLIVDMLSKLLGDVKGIDFIGHDQAEQVVELCGKDWSKNLLLKHDFNGKSKSEDKMQSEIGRLARQYGVKVDYAICGHLHSAKVGDNFARSSSLCGANAYSDYSLGLSGSASQNCYIFTKTGHKASVIDLQNTADEMYPIEESLEAYHAKSVDKTKSETNILKIVI